MKHIANQQIFPLNSSLNMSNQSLDATKARVPHNWKSGPYQVIQKLKAEEHS